MIAWRHHVRAATLSGSRRGAEAPALLALLIAGLAIGAAGCHKKVPPSAPAPPPPAATPAPPPPSTPPPAAPAPAPAPTKLTEEEAFARKSLDELNAEHPLDDVFFDLDRAEIRQDAHAPLQKDAEWLGKWKSARITVEGHCDARGSSEYNLALGSRRADAVKAYLANLGVASERMTVISKGKEQPFCREANESCWQQNRRGHFLVTGK